MSASSTAPRSKALIARWRKPLLITAGVAALWTGLVGAWLPDWVRPRIETAASEALGTPVRIARIRIRPWRGVVGIEDLSIGTQAAPMLHVRQAEAQLSLESLWRLAPVLRRVTLVEPELWIERQSAERFNFTPILDKLMAGPGRPDDEAPQRFAVFNIQLRDGGVRYTDRVLSQAHRVDQIQIGVPFLSNLPSQVHVDVKPLISARVDGSPLRIQGRTLPFDEGLKSEMAMVLEAVDVPHWVAVAGPFLPAEWLPAARAGRLDAALTVGFEARKPPALPLLSIKGRVQVDKLGMDWQGAPVLGEAALDWDSLKVEGIDVAPFARQAALGKVDLAGLRWRSAPGAAGTWARPAAGDRADDKTVGKPAGRSGGKPDEGKAWSWRIDRLRVQTGRIDVQPVPMADAKPAGKAPRWPALDSVGITASGLDSRDAAKPATWRLALRDEHQASLTVQGQAGIARRTVDAQLSLTGLKLAPWLAPVQPMLGLPVALSQGELGLQATVNARLADTSVGASVPSSETAGAKLSGKLQLQGIEAHAAHPGLKDQIRLAGLVLDGVQAEVALTGTPALRRAVAARLDLDRLDATLTRGPRGEWLGRVPAGDAQADAKTEVEGAVQAALPHIELGAFHCEACQARVTDQTVTPAARFDISGADLRMAGLSTRLSDPVKVDLDTSAQGKGRVRFNGQVRPRPLSVDGRVTVAGLDLRVAQPYIDPWVNITLAAARAQAEGQISLQDKGAAGLSARYKGRAALSDLRVQDRVNDADFLRWQSLSLDGVDANWAGQALDADLSRIALKDFYGRVIINPGGALNLAGIVRQQGGEARSLTTPEAGAAPPGVKAAASAPLPGGGVAAASATLKPAAADAAARPKLRWQQIRLSKGRVDFTDNFIKPNYSARLTQIEGEVSAVSSTRPEPATIKVSGAVDDAAPLLISGRLHPLGPRLYTDIEGSAKGIELTRLTPYASRYAGYAIEKGSLSVTVHYKVDGGRLDASNRIFLDQLTFGEKTDSPEALNLPVRLAVSLLQNSRGEIDVNLPISGSLDDPEFSVGGIVWRVILNLVAKAVTAPFSLLAGGGSDELGVVAFEPGSARLGDAATQRLDALAATLIDRPALKLEATGRADPALDAEGLRRAHVNRLMRAAKAKATGEPASDVRIGDDERTTWLKAAYKAADIKKPRNLIGLAKDIGADEMDALLGASAPADDEALRQLANRRGDAVKAYLAARLPPERVLLTASKIGKDGLREDKEPSTRVQFTVK